MTGILVFKLVLVLLLLFIVFNLGRALFILVKGESSVPMSQYLGRRVLFSVLVIVLLLLALGLGIISPNPRPY
ncbi:DUF2909 family protein [Shewanella colwelliana]|uniref:DUF2909 domain-containing protein n=1 Tax=Shewanella colwelliana TaxID=23 RepID=A0ABQ4NXR2_SHECO|nr:DUF2909 family protein [Shewanella colwelliana]MCZ4338336.1 DUF2909 family protein [Shewanella colwelliana]MDX1281440.1 DUF2909 family protein [Shewanella colwelliana]GIU16986.1 hypothetical protein TUM4644_01680 [Shewanella colwelliana]GIU39402.1 hypothetical protein TUM3794_14220 [Shewanella colwelliana]